MTKDEIIQSIYLNPKIKKYINSICPNDSDELTSELVIQLYKMDYVKLLLAHNTNYIEYLCFTISKRILYGNISGSGIFYKKSKVVDLIEDIDHHEESNNDYEENLEKVKEILEKKHWYGKTLFKLYYIEGYNLREISEKYGINIKSIHYTIDKLKKEIKKEL